MSATNAAPADSDCRMAASLYPAYFRRNGKRSATWHLSLLIFQISITVQTGLKLFEELLLQLGIQIGVFHLVTELS